jgi:hypothetical protein
VRFVAFLLNGLAITGIVLAIVGLYGSEPLDYR